MNCSPHSPPSWPHSRIHRGLHGGLCFLGLPKPKAEAVGGNDKERAEHDAAIVSLELWIANALTPSFAETSAEGINTLDMKCAPVLARICAVLDNSHLHIVTCQNSGARRAFRLRHHTHSKDPLVERDRSLDIWNRQIKRIALVSERFSKRWCGRRR
eukprot:Amastigsp_a5099_27.p1 type:complete len:157 gc:universal Amastigsp_a5099_27:534-64(-)